MFRNQIAIWAIKAKNYKSWKSMKNGYELFWSSRDKMLSYQNKSFEEILLYAYHHTRYYHRIFDEIGLIQDGKIDVNRYKDIPILTKDIIRKEGENLISDEQALRGGYSNTSGGSTGEPVKFVQDKCYFSKNFGDKILFGILNEKKPGDKEIKLWGNEKDILEGSIGFKEKCINWCYNRTFLNSFILTTESMQRYIQIINKKKPKQIWTYADSIYQLAKYINQNRIEVHSPYNIISTAGVLYEDMRTEIEKAFKGSNLLNQYGSREAGVIGCEIGKERGIRVFDHSVKIEILDGSTGTISDSGEGELLVTNLTNYSMPLIRYKIGDTGELSQKLDGYPGSFSVLKKLTGRTNAHLLREDGSMVHGEYVTHLFYNKEWVENFKVIQHTCTEIEFQIVIKDGYQIDENELEIMKQDLKKVLGECIINVNYMKEIPKLQSGKYQFVISEVADANLRR